MNMEKETGLLDLLFVVAENLRLLILGPILVGLITLGVSYALPQSFVSQAILALPSSAPPQASVAAQATAMMMSPIVLDSVIEALNLSDGRPIEIVRRELVSKVKISLGRDGLLHLDVVANTPIQAQTISNGIINAWLKTTVPKGQDRADLEKRLTYAKASLESLNRLFDRFTNESTDDLKKPLTRSDAGSFLAGVSDLQTSRLGEVLAISRGLEGISREVVKQPPTLATMPTAPNIPLNVILAVIGTGFVLLLWVFIRYAWENTARDSDAAKKQLKLRAAIGFKQ